ncbi:MAG: hypothetical protein U0169_23050 [Polyangiaceae bacterium]
MVPVPPSFARRSMFLVFISGSLGLLGVGAGGCTADVGEERADVDATEFVAPPEVATTGLLTGAREGDWCGNRNVSDSAYLHDRSIGAFKCAAAAVCGRLGPTASMICSTGMSAVLELAKDDPDSANVMWSMAGAAATNANHHWTVLSLIAASPKEYGALVAKVGEARAVKMMDTFVKVMGDPRIQPSLKTVPKSTYIGLAMSCAEAVRGACDLAVNTVYAVQENWEAWVSPDFKGSVPGCSKSTAVAVTNYTYGFWRDAQGTFETCVSSCRAEADSCGGSRSRACNWWNACVNYCAATKMNSVNPAASYRMTCEPAPVTVANAYLQCLGRAPSADELRGWVEAEAKGADVTRGICQSEEARSR